MLIMMISTRRKLNATHQPQPSKRRRSLFVFFLSPLALVIIALSFTNQWEIDQSLNDVDDDEDNSVVRWDSENSNQQSLEKYQAPPQKLPKTNLVDTHNLPPRPVVADETTPKFSPRTSLKNNPIEFVHITKTGGTAIEQAAAQAGITWGMCHFMAQKHWGIGGGCHRADWKAPYIQWWNFEMEQWHVPPLWLEPNPYKKSTTFTVVRNPYDRILSEYYCKFFGYHRAEYWGKPNDAGQLTRTGNQASVRSQGDRQRFSRLRRQALNFDDIDGESVPATRKDRGMKRNNIFMQKNLRREFLMNQPHRKLKGAREMMNNNQRPFRIRNKVQDSPATLNRWIRDHLKIHMKTGHMLPQHYYIYDGNGVQVVNHILRFENLSRDFNELMKQYDMPSVALEKSVNQGHDSGTPRMSVNDINRDTIELINVFYRRDFELFGYDMIES